MKTAKLITTQLERSIVVLMARGYAPKQIAASLGMTAHQVSKARRRILARNGIANDLELGMLVERTGFLSTGERILIEDRRLLRAQESLQ